MTIHDQIKEQFVKLLNSDAVVWGRDEEGEITAHADWGHRAGGKGPSKGPWELFNLFCDKPMGMGLYGQSGQITKISFSADQEAELQKLGVTKIPPVETAPVPKDKMYGAVADENSGCRL